MNTRRQTVSETLAVSQRTGARLVRLNGILDENFDGGAMLKALSPSSDPVVFDLDGIRRVTSFGVREWILALQSLPTDRYFFIHCRPSVVAQLNLVSNFAGCGQVVTLYCPYVCSQCERSFEVLLDLRTHRDRARRATPLSASCPDCKAPASFDDSPESYFSFCADAPPVITPPAVERIIGSAALDRLPLKISKEVDGAVTAIWISGTIDDATRFRRLHEGLEGQVVIIAQAVAGLTPEGMVALTDFLAGAEEPFSLARIPLELVRAIVEFPERWQQVRLVSVRLAWRCQACGMAGLGDLDVKDQALLMLKRAAGGLRKCHFCLAESSGPMLLEDDLEMVLSLHLVRPAEPIGVYLDRHDQPAAEVRQRPGDDGPGAGLPGSRSGRYEVIHPLGKGGMAEVFLGRQLGLEGFEKSVVIKCILRKFASDPRFVEMFLREARMAARIIHSNVVQIFDLGRSGDNYYIVMEYVRGCSLNDIFLLCSELNMEIPLELCCRIVSDVCAGLHAAHNAIDEHGQPQVIIHRDVSPENVLISFDGLVKLADFGIAKAVAPRAVTRSGSIEGKILYMAPETAREDAFDHRADVFAAGLIFFVALTGVHPFKRTGYVDTLAALLGDEFPPLSRLRPQMPDFLDEVAERALARDPDLRYQSALALHLDLESFLARNGKPATSTYLALFLNNLIRKGENAGVRLDFSSPHRVVRDAGPVPPPDAHESSPTLSTSQTIIEFRSEQD